MFLTLSLQDLDILKAIQWQAVIVEKSQSAEIWSHFSRIKCLSTVKRLLVFCGPLGVNMTSYLDVLSKLDLDVLSKTELDDMSKLKETLSILIAYECKSNSSQFVEFRVPVQISNVQLEQYCSMLLSNAMALGSKRKLRVLILHQSLSGSGKDSASIRDILDDFLRQRFGEDS
nr:helicase protein MOM1-like isoform X1 [Tanacetum cinerariifolium]